MKPKVAGRSPSGNRDSCGRCLILHGGNDHACTVHGAVSRGCCDPRCNPVDWQRVFDEWDATAHIYRYVRALAEGEYPPNLSSQYRIRVEKVSSAHCHSE